jgi:hypothetical protein
MAPFPVLLILLLTDYGKCSIFAANRPYWPWRHMQRSAPTNGSTGKSWRCVVVSLITLVLGLSIALPFSTPTAVGYVQLPGVIIGVFVAGVCVVSFFLCPRRPLFAKLIALLLCVPALFCALDFVAYYWLHVRHGG